MINIIMVFRSGDFVALAFYLLLPLLEAAPQVGVLLIQCIVFA
jgi:hypothetical protein